MSFCVVLIIIMKTQTQTPQLCLSCSRRHLEIDSKCEMCAMVFIVFAWLVIKIQAETQNRNKNISSFRLFELPMITELMHKPKGNKPEEDKKRVFGSGLERCDCFVCTRGKWLHVSCTMYICIIWGAWCFCFLDRWFQDLCRLVHRRQRTGHHRTNGLGAKCRKRHRGHWEQ